MATPNTGSAVLMPRLVLLDVPWAGITQHGLVIEWCFTGHIPLQMIEQCQAQELELCQWRYYVKRQNVRLLTRQSIHSRFPHTTGCVLWLSREASAANHVARTLAHVLATGSICDMRRRCSIVVPCQSQLEGHVGLTNIAQLNLNSE